MVHGHMQVTVSRISPVVLELSIEVSKETVATEVERAYVTLAKRAFVKGFRPGKTPRPVLKQLFAPQVASDVAQALVQTTLPQALTQEKVTPINQPMVELGAVSTELPFSYKARFEVQPELENVRFEGFELERPFAEVDDVRVDEEMENLRKQFAKFEPPATARAAIEGDVVTIDFKVSVGGTEIADAGGEGVSLELGAGQALPELEKVLLGGSVGDARTAETKFGDNHPRKDFQGKMGTFNITIKEVKERVLPNLDDEFAKDLGNFQTLVELRADVHTKLTKVMKDASETAVAEQIVLRLNEANPCDVPPSLVEAQGRLMEQEVVAQSRRMNQRFTKESAELLQAQIRLDAEKKVRAGLVMASLARKNEFKVTEEDLEKGLAELSSETGKNIAKLRVEYRPKEKRDILVGMILEDKILDFIESKSKIVDLKKGETPKLLQKPTEAPAKA
jgi:trigger factor